MVTTSIHVRNVNVNLLRKQYHTLIELSSSTNAYQDRSTPSTPAQKRSEEHLDGLINLLEEMLDIAEGRVHDRTNVATLR